jgi:hypothetical protein
VSDPIYPDPFVLHADDVDSGELTGYPSGPAGVAELELADGTTVVVDYIDPDVAVSLRLDWVADPAPLERLIGGRRAAACLEALAGGPSGEPVRLDGDDGRRRVAPSVEPVRTARRRQIGVAALESSAMVDETLPVLARLTAAVELIDLLSGSLSFVDRNGSRAAVARRVAVELVTVCRDELERLAQDDRYTAARIITGIERLGVPGTEGLADLVRRSDHDDGDDDDDDFDDDFDDEFGDLRDLTGRFGTPAYALQSPAMPDAFGFLSFDDDDFAFPEAGESAPSPLRQVQLVDGLLSVTFRRHPGGDWLRVVSRGELELLAVAPVRFSDDADEWTAITVVPPSYSVVDLDITTVDDPFPLVAEGADRLSLLAAAVRLGQRAVRASVLDELDIAADLWRRCAEAWEAAGDHRRASMARGYADGDIDVRRRARVTDRVLHALDAL